MQNYLLYPGCLLLSCVNTRSQGYWIIACWMLTVLLLSIPDPSLEAVAWIAALYTLYVHLAYLQVEKLHYHNLALFFESLHNGEPPRPLAPEDMPDDRMAQRCNELARRNEKLQRLLQDCAEESGFTANELEIAARHLHDGAAQQDRQIDSIASAGEQISQSVAQIVGRIEQAQVKAEQAVRQTAQGNDTADRLCQEMQVLEESISDAQCVIERLKGRSDAIQAFVVTINEVTSQINLLSLNAAIESARAGEAGRGFAVVANEVRRLACDTETATSDITQLLTDIHNDIGSTVSRMARCQSRIKQGAEVSRQIAGDMQQMNQRARSRQQMIVEIQEAIREHNLASDEIGQRLMELTQLATVTNDRSIDVLDMMHYLHGLADRLHAETEPAVVGGKEA